MTYIELLKSYPEFPRVFGIPKNATWACITIDRGIVTVECRVNPPRLDASKDGVEDK